MVLKILMDGKEHKINLSHKAELREIYEKVSANPQVYLAKKGNSILTVYDKVKDGDEIELIKIVSGG